MVVLLTTVSPLVSTPLKLTPVTPTTPVKLLPVRVTSVPGTPLVGEKEVMTGQGPTVTAFDRNAVLLTVAVAWKMPPAKPGVSVAPVLPPGFQT